MDAAECRVTGLGMKALMLLLQTSRRAERGAWPPAVGQEPAASAAVPTTSSCSKKYHRHTQDSSREILTYSTQGEFYFFLFRAEGVIRITKEGGVRKLGWTEQAVTPQGWPPRAAQGSGGHLGSATSPEVDGAQSSLEKVTLHVTSMIL